MKKLIFISMSVEVYIADQNDSLDFLSIIPLYENKDLFLVINRSFSYSIFQQVVLF